MRSVQIKLKDMSIIGEHLSAMAADQLEKVLLEAATDSQWSDCRSAVMGFARKTIYPLYKVNVDDSYGLVKINPEIEKIYGK